MEKMTVFQLLALELLYIIAIGVHVQDKEKFHSFWWASAWVSAMVIPVVVLLYKLKPH